MQRLANGVPNFIRSRLGAAHGRLTPGLTDANWDRPAFIHTCTEAGRALLREANNVETLFGDRTVPFQDRAQQYPFRSRA